MAEPRVLVTGGAGQLGQELDRLLGLHRVTHWCLDLPEMDVTSQGQVKYWLDETRPSLVVHAAARTNVDACETDRAAAMTVNAEATRQIASLCALQGIPLVYISTDYIFDGSRRTPYRTDDPAHPLNAYGESKLKGEAGIRAAGGAHWIVRTSWLYGVHGQNFPKTILGLAAGGKTPRVVADQVGSPAYVRDLAAAICTLAGIIPPETPRPHGVYHYSNSGTCSWWAFANEILARTGWLASNPRLAPEPIPSTELARPAGRPSYSALSLAGTKAVGIRIRPWQEALGEFLGELRQSSPALFPSEALMATASEDRMPVGPGRLERRMKGIILAGGTGSRLFPLTKVTNKHLLPVGRYPMIYHPIAKLAEAGIQDILVVTGKEHMGAVVGILGSGKNLGLEFTYRVQDQAGGIAEALGLAEAFAAGDKCVVILGDNVFSDSLEQYVTAFAAMPRGARVLLKEVCDPHRYGVAEVRDGKVVSIEEKPARPKSSLCITGIYMYDGMVFDIIRTLKPSGRGELEITDVNNAYLALGLLSFDILPGWWTDAGTFDSLAAANDLAREVSLMAFESSLARLEAAAGKE